MTHLTPAQQAALDRIKAKFPVESADLYRYSTGFVHAALDELYAELCPPLDADVVAEIRTLEKHYSDIVPEDNRWVLNWVLPAIRETAAIFQRQSAQGSVEWVETGDPDADRSLLVNLMSYAITERPRSHITDSLAAKFVARVCLDKLTGLQYEARDALVRLVTPATSDKEARVKELEAAMEKARNLFRQIAQERRKLGPLATHAQSMAWELSSLLPTAPTEGE